MLRAMNRIEAIFTALRQRGRKALMPFLTAGDPDLPTTGLLLEAIERALPDGTGICELGVPFSDPIADGPVIQESMNHALTCGLRAEQILELVARKRSQLKIGLVAMVSYSIVHRLGGGTFLDRSAKAGIDGFIFPDLPVEASEPIRQRAAAAGLTSSFLIAPTTPPQRAERIAQACSGFVYVLARAGVTGERSELPADLTDRIRQLRQVTDLPIAVGFGIASAQQVRQVTAAADGAIVGSAIVRRLARYRSATGANDPQAAAAEVEEFVAELASGLAP